MTDHAESAPPLPAGLAPGGLAARGEDAAERIVRLHEAAARACASSRPAPGHAMLLDALWRAASIDFELRVSRGGWYRAGRILGPDGGCVTDDALGWLERAWAQADGDPQALAGHDGHTVTRFEGVTHYFVAPLGTGSGDFLQLEVEELHERASFRFGADAPVPDSVDALIAPRGASSAALADGPPHYSFRRLTDIDAFVARLASQAGSAPPVVRFLAEWDASGRGQRRFCDHWVLALSEHEDRYRQKRLAAAPVPVRAPCWAGGGDSRGIALAQQLHEFDRDAGFRAAWYFHMVCGHRVPREVAPRVFADLQAGMAYLPERDAALVAGWLRDPYCL